MFEINNIYNMDCLKGLKLMPDNSIDCCVTSPPYYALRDYGIKSTLWPTTKYFPMTGVPYEIGIPEWNGSLGLEPTIEMFIAHIVLIFREVKRVLKDDGTLWLNFGDSFVGTGGNRKHDVKNELFQEQQSHNPGEGRYERNKQAKKSGLKVKDLMGIPWRAALALQADGWYLRSDIIWNKSNPMPESVLDRPTKAHEYIFLLSKQSKYYYDAESIKEPITESTFQRISQNTENQDGSKRANGGNKTNGTMKAVISKQFSHDMAAGAYNIDMRKHFNKSGQPYITKNKRTVWTVATSQFKEAHFATFPGKLIEPCILAGCPKGGLVLDPFMGSGTTAAKAVELQRNYIGFEINPEYIKMAEEFRLNEVQIKMA